MGLERERMNMNAFCLGDEIHWRAASGAGLGKKREQFYVKEFEAC